MKKLLMMVVLCLSLVGCSGKNTDSEQAKKTEQAMAEADRQVGMPNITNFSERKLLKRVYELRDQENLVMYAYTQGLDGQLIFLFKCMGYGVPYAAQYTNPQKYTPVYNKNGTWDTSLLMPQPEPNGIFIPDSSEGTWLLVIDEKGNTHPVYCEPRVVVSPVKILTAKGNP